MFLDVNLLSRSNSVFFELLSIEFYRYFGPLADDMNDWFAIFIASSKEGSSAFFLIGSYYGFEISSSFLKSAFVLTASSTFFLTYGEVEGFFSVYSSSLLSSSLLPFK